MLRAPQVGAGRQLRYHREGVLLITEVVQVTYLDDHLYGCGVTTGYLGRNNPQKAVCTLPLTVALGLVQTGPFAVSLEKGEKRMSDDDEVIHERNRTHKKLSISGSRTLQSS